MRGLLIGLLLAAAPCPAISVNHTRPVSGHWYKAVTVQGSAACSGYARTSLFSIRLKGRVRSANGKTSCSFLLTKSSRGKRLVVLVVTMHGGGSCPPERKVAWRTTIR